MDITSIIPLTDYTDVLNFATLSLDSTIKVFSIDGDLESEAIIGG
jgi:hypothetical protein